MDLSSENNEATYTIYQPEPRKQALLYDMATCLSVSSYLSMNSDNNITAVIRHATNAEFMSENGKVPVVVEKENEKPFCGFAEFFWHIARKHERSPSLLELAYMDWVESNFLLAEMYICWCYEPVLNTYTKKRYTFDLPWPVSTILFNRKRDQIQNSVGKKFKNFEEFLEKFNQFLSSLNKRIGNKSYCLEDNPSSVDALIYGHSKAIESENLNPRFLDAITKQRRIMNLSDLIHRTYPSYR